MGSCEQRCTAPRPPAARPGDNRCSSLLTGAAPRRRGTGSGKPLVFFRLVMVNRVPGSLTLSANLVDFCIQSIRQVEVLISISRSLLVHQRYVLAGNLCINPPETPALGTVSGVHIPPPDTLHNLQAYVIYLSKGQRKNDSPCFFPGVTPLSL